MEIKQQEHITVEQLTKLFTTNSTEDMHKLAKEMDMPKYDDMDGVYRVLRRCAKNNINKIKPKYEDITEDDFNLLIRYHNAYMQHTVLKLNMIPIHYTPTTELKAIEYLEKLATTVDPEINKLEGKLHEELDGLKDIFEAGLKTHLHNNLDNKSEEVSFNKDILITMAKLHNDSKSMVMELDIFKSKLIKERIDRTINGKDTTEIIEFIGEVDDRIAIHTEKVEEISHEISLRTKCPHEFDDKECKVNQREQAYVDMDKLCKTEFDISIKPLLAGEVSDSKLSEVLEGLEDYIDMICSQGDTDYTDELNKLIGKLKENSVNMSDIKDDVEQGIPRNASQGSVSCSSKPRGYRMDEKTTLGVFNNPQLGKSGYEYSDEPKLHGVYSFSKPFLVVVTKISKDNGLMTIRELGTDITYDNISKNQMYPLQASLSIYDQTIMRCETEDNNLNSKIYTHRGQTIVDNFAALYRPKPRGYRMDKKTTEEVFNNPKLGSCTNMYVDDMKLYGVYNIFKIDEVSKIAKPILVVVTGIVHASSTDTITGAISGLYDGKDYGIVTKQQLVSLNKGQVVHGYTISEVNNKPNHLNSTSIKLLDAHAITDNFAYLSKYAIGHSGYVTKVEAPMLKTSINYIDKPKLHGVYIMHKQSTEYNVSYPVVVISISEDSKCMLVRELDTTYVYNVSKNQLSPLKVGVQVYGHIITRCETEDNNLNSKSITCGKKIIEDNFVALYRPTPSEIHDKSNNEVADK